MKCYSKISTGNKIISMTSKDHYYENKNFFKMTAEIFNGFYDAKDTNNLRHTIWQKLARKIIVHQIKKTYKSFYRRFADIGCGNGDFCCYLNENFPIDTIYGIDFSPETLKVAKRVHHKPGLSFEVGDIRNIPLKSGSVDVTLCINTLHHIFADDLPEALSELARISKDILILEIKNENDIYTRYFKPRSFRGINVYPTSFKKVSKILENYNFEVMEKANIFFITFLSPIQILVFKRINRSN
jgi:ubiquinone/menaquinone biosynthesis C-methylase UbiE